MSTVKATNFSHPSASDVGITLGADGSVVLPQGFTGGIGSNVVQTVKTDVFSASLAGGTRSSALLAASITPTTATSKILVIPMLGLSENVDSPAFEIYRDNAVLTAFKGDSGANDQGTGGAVVAGGRNAPSIGYVALDSPATTSAVTYDVRLFHDSGVARVVYLNRGTTDGIRTTSTLTLIEVAA